MTTSTSKRVKLTNSVIKDLEPQIRRVNDSDISGFHLLISAKGKMTYYIYYRLDGKQVNFKLGSHPDITPMQARDLAKKKLGEVANGVDVQVQKKEAKLKTEREKLTKLSTFLDEKYLSYQTTRNAKTAEKLIKSIKTGFPTFLDKQLSSIDASSIEKWRNEKKKEGAKPSTINGYVSTLKAALSRAVDWGLIETNGLDKVKKLKNDNTRIRYLSDDEKARLTDALAERDHKIKTERENGNLHRQQRGYEELPSLMNKRFSDHLEPIVLLAMYTGMRRGEIFSLKWVDVSLKAKQPHLTVKPDNAKSGKGRYIPLNQITLSVLKDWKKESGTSAHVFENSEGKPFNDIKKAWNNLLVSAEIENFRFHDLRHQFASMLVMKGVDLNTVRELLGHSTLEMTLRYAHLAPDHKAAALSLLV